jgi:hypothetical protein
MNLAELLDRTFFLYRQHFLLFTGITALPHLLLLALQMFGVIYNPPQPFTPTFGFPLFSIVMLVVQLIVMLVIYAATHAATVTAVSRLYLGGSASVVEVYSAIRGKILLVVWMMVVLGIASGVGFLFCIIPGVVLWLLFFLSVPVAILERKGLIDAATRSAELTRGWRFHILAIYLLYIVLIYVFTILWEIPVLLLGFMASSGDPTAMPTWVLVVVAIGSFFTSCLATPLLSIATALVYYNQRVRNEGFDLEHMMSMLDDVAPASTS